MITVEADTLRAALWQVKKRKISRVYLRQLAGVLQFITYDENTRLSSWPRQQFDLDVSGQLVKGKAEGPECSVNLNRLTKLVRLIPKEAMFRMEIEDRYLSLGTDFASYQIPVTWEELGPLHYDSRGEQIGRFNRATLKTDLEALKHCVSTDSLRASMQHVYVDREDGQPIVVGTDGHKLVKLPLDGEVPEGTMIPRPVLMDLRKMTGEEAVIWRNTEAYTDMRGREQERTVYEIRSENRAVYWVDAEEEFLNYAKVIDPADSFPDRITIEEVGLVKQALKRLDALSDFEGVEIDVEDGLVTASIMAGSDWRGSREIYAEETLPVEVSAARGKMAVNPGYFWRILRAMDAPVTMRFKYSQHGRHVASPIQLEDEAGRFFLLMPIMLENGQSEPWRDDEHEEYRKQTTQAHG